MPLATAWLPWQPAFLLASPSLPLSQRRFLLEVAVDNRKRTRAGAVFFNFQAKPVIQTSHHLTFGALNTDQFQRPAALLCMFGDRKIGGTLHPRIRGIDRRIRSRRPPWAGSRQRQIHLR